MGVGSAWMGDIDGTFLLETGNGKNEKISSHQGLSRLTHGIVN